MGDIYSFFSLLYCLMLGAKPVDGNTNFMIKRIRDRLLYPYTERDGMDYISADENETFAFAITVGGKSVGSIGEQRDQGRCIGFYLCRRTLKWKTGSEI